MPTINFRIKGSKELKNIYVRLRHQKIDCESNTNIKIHKKHWSDAKKKAKSIAEINYTEINNNLDKIKRELLNYFNEEFTNGQIINKYWLKEKINLIYGIANENEEDYKVFFIELIDLIIKESKTRKNKKGTTISENTIKHYTTTLNKLKKYESDSNLKLKIKDINLNFHHKFINYLETKEKLNPNTIGGYIEDIKFFCNRAESKRIEINNEVKLNEFYIPANETYDTYLNEKEINSIFNHDYTNNKKLDKARDWLIIGLWTGLRVSDLFTLNKSNIEDGFLNITTKKTEYPVIIPIHPQIDKILKKRNGEFPNQISHQKFNEYIKDICSDCEINEIIVGAKQTKIKHNGKEIYRKIKGKYPKNQLVSSHICRRSFATNHYSKIDTLTIMKITGHKSEKQFLNYIKITPKEYAIRMRELWSKIYS